MTFSQWQEFALTVRERGERIDRMRHERGFAIASAAGISRDMCCIHNASISEPGQGWGAGPNGRNVIKSARRAIRLLNNWAGSTKASEIIHRAWLKIDRF